MTSISYDERNEFSIDFKHFSDFSCERDRRMDRRTDRASYRDAMAHLKIILAYFWNISSDFCFFLRFSTRALCDRLTNRPTDRAAYRGAMAHLKIKVIFQIVLRPNSIWTWLNRRRYVYLFGNNVRMKTVEKKTNLFLFCCIRFERTKFQIRSWYHFYKDSKLLFYSWISSCWVFLVACNATLHPALSVRPLVGWSVCRFVML